MFWSFCPNEACEIRTAETARRGLNLMWIASTGLDATKYTKLRESGCGAENPRLKPWAISRTLQNSDFLQQSGIAFRRGFLRHA
jgi:hypothetical protein